MHDRVRGNRWNPVCVSLIAAAGLFGAAAWSADPPTASAPAAPKGSFAPVQTIEQLMAGQEKLYNEIKDGILDKAWAEAEVSAWLLAELANVNHYQSDEAPYRQFADQMKAQCVDVAKALRKREVQLAKAALTRVSETCAACHDRYRKSE